MSECLREEWAQMDLGVKVSVEKFIGPLQECRLVTEHKVKASPLKGAL